MDSMHALDISGKGRTDVVVQKFDLWEGEGVVDAQEDGWLHKDVNQVHHLMAKEECRCAEACITGRKEEGISTNPTSLRLFQSWQQHINLTAISQQHIKTNCESSNKAPNQGSLKTHILTQNARL